MYLWYCTCRLFPTRDSWFCEFCFRHDEYLRLKTIFFWFYIDYIFCDFFFSDLGFKKQRCLWKCQVCTAGELLDRAEFSKFSLFAFTKKKGPQLSKCWILHFRKPWSTWGPNILHACDKTKRCTVLSWKRERSSATRPAAFGMIALDVSKPQRRNARSVAFFYFYFLSNLGFLIP